mgnify:CR=1 FL=1
MRCTSALRPSALGLICSIILATPSPAEEPGPVADDWDRNLDVLRLSNLTAITLGGSSTLSRT